MKTCDTKFWGSRWILEKSMTAGQSFPSRLFQADSDTGGRVKKESHRLVRQLLQDLTLQACMGWMPLVISWMPAMQRPPAGKARMKADRSL
jgi:hypothetical protein